MKLKRKFLSTAMAVICGVNMCVAGGISANAVETVPGYNNVDNYMADGILNGYVSLETGVSKDANSLYNPDNISASISDTIAESIIEQDGIVPENFTELNAEIFGDVTKQQLYEIFLANIFTYESNKVSWAAYEYDALMNKAGKYTLALLSELVGVGAASSEEQAQMMLESTSQQDNTKMLEALKKLGYKDSLSVFSDISAALSEAENSAIDYFSVTASGLAIAELEQDKVDMLKEMKNASSDDDFSAACDTVIKAIENTYSNSEADIWSQVKQDISAVKDKESALAAINGLFDVNDESAEKMFFLMQYNVKNYLNAAVENEYNDYYSKSDEVCAEDLHTAYRNSLVYQLCVSDMAIAYSPAVSDEDYEDKLQREISNDSTKITIIDIWYENYLEYTDTETVDIDFESSDIIEYNGHYYKVFNNSISWIYAKEYCELMGGHLATITDEKEQQVVEQLSTQSPEFDNFWIGGYREKNSSKTDGWKWVDGTEFNFEYWDDNQPDFHQGEEYYIRFTNKDIDYESWTAHKGKWNDCANEASGSDNTGDAVGIQTFAFICEWDSEISFIIGDANNDEKVNVRDAAFIASMLAKNQSGMLTFASDFNEDGKINVRDAAAIASALAKGLIK